MRTRAKKMAQGNLLRGGGRLMAWTNNCDSQTPLDISMHQSWAGPWKFKGR